MEMNSSLLNLGYLLNLSISIPFQFNRIMNFKFLFFKLDTIRDRALRSKYSPDFLTEYPSNANISILGPLEEYSYRFEKKEAASRIRIHEKISTLRL